MDIQKRTLWMLGAVIAVQVFDIGLHVAVNEVEPLRVLSNLVLIAGASFGALAQQNWRPVIWTAALAYVILNLAFVAIYGLVNPETGINRAPLFVFMAVSLWLTYRVEQLRLKASLV
ncbi:MAG: hypothetical protein AAFR98_12245 [Pseudomonadota bacterium]